MIKDLAHLVGKPIAAKVIEARAQRACQPCLHVLSSFTARLNSSYQAHVMSGIGPRFAALGRFVWQAKMSVGCPVGQ